MAAEERVVVPIRLAQEIDNAIMLPMGMSKLSFSVMEGESSIEAAQRVAVELSAKNLMDILRERKTPATIGAVLPEKPSVLVQKERTIGGRAVRLGRHSLWKTVDKVSIAN